MRQAFASPAAEVLYGLGQHQNGVINYKGQQVDLTQNNTDVAVPFLLSSRNYGTLWDNYSVTKAGDSRDYEPLNTLKMYSKEGNKGWLTVTYINKNKLSEVLFQRPESVIQYHFPKDQKNFSAGLKLGDAALATWEGSIADQFVFGLSLLVNPVTDCRVRSRKLYLPAVTGWFDFYSGKYLAGGQTLAADVPLERLPLYVKEGSILPFGPAVQYTAEKPADPIMLYVYIGKDAVFTLCEDKGVNYNYEKGTFANIPLRYDEHAKTLTIGARRGILLTMAAQRSFRVVLGA